MLTNIPEVKLGIVAVSRDCFIISLSERRRRRGGRGSHQRPGQRLLRDAQLLL